MSEEKVNLHKGHRERMRKQFLADLGAGQPDHKLLELLLFYAIPQKDTNELAHILLQKFGSIRGVLEADVNELYAISGIKENAAVLFKLIMELFRRYADTQNTLLDTSQAVATYMLSKMMGVNEERLYLLCLNDLMNVQRCVQIGAGSDSGVALNLKKIVREATSSHCNVVILVHNHPGNNLQPSTEDIQCTVRVGKMLSELGVVLADHVIVSGTNYISMKDAGIFTVSNYNETLQYY